MLIAANQNEQKSKKNGWLQLFLRPKKREQVRGARDRQTRLYVVCLRVCMSVCGRVLPVRMSVGRLYYEPHTVMEYD